MKLGQQLGHVGEPPVILGWQLQRLSLLGDTPDQLGAGSPGVPVSLAGHVGDVPGKGRPPVSCQQQSGGDNLMSGSCPGAPEEGDKNCHVLALGRHNSWGQHWQEVSVGLPWHVVSQQQVESPDPVELLNFCSLQLPAPEMRRSAKEF